MRGAHDLLLNTLRASDGNIGAATGGGGGGVITLNTIAFTTVINGWARSNYGDAAEKAQDLLSTMSSLYAKGDVQCKPNAFTFSGVIRAVVRSVKRGAAKSAAEGAALRAEALLRLMDRLYAEEGDADVMPDSILFTTVMNAWANVGDGDSAERAEALLRRMEHLHSRGEARIKPDAVAYSSAIKAWTRAASSGYRGGGSRPDAPERAEALLREMERRYGETGDPDVRPDTIAYTSIIRAWTKGRGGGRGGRSGDAGRMGAERAEQLLLNLEAQYEATGVEDVKPDAVAYGTVINAWAESGARGSAERAASLLRRMSNLHKSTGDNDIKPDAVAYTAVIKAMVAAGRRGEAGSEDNAERVLRRMERLYEETGDEDIRPDVVTYGTVIDAWAECSKPGGAGRAVALLRVMEEMHARGDGNVRPNAVSCTSVIKAFVNDPEVSGNEASAFSEELLAIMMSQCLEEGDVMLRPTERTFQWARIAAESGGDAEAVERIESMRCEIIGGGQRRRSGAGLGSAGNI